MAEATPFSPDREAGSHCEPCQQKAASGGSGEAAPAKATTPPCDLKSLTVTLETPYGTISKTGFKPEAHPPIDGLSSELNHLLQMHSVVIHRVSPATAAPTQLQGAHGSAGGTPALPVVGKARASAAMKSNCGAHPEMVETPEPADKAKAGKLSISTTEWKVSDFGAMMFRGKSVGDLVFGDRAHKIFDADTCGRPASGDPVGSLSGIAQIAIADEWDITLHGGKGIELKLSTSTKYSAEESYGKGYRGTSEKIESKTEKNLESTGWTRKSKVEDSLSGDTYRSVEHSGGTTTTIDYLALESESKSKRESKDTFNADGSRKIRSSVRDSFTLKIQRNGATVFDPSEIVKSLEKFGEELSAVFQRLARLKELFDRGARVAFPGSLTFDLAFALTLLKGSVRARFWPERRQPLQGPHHYIEDFRTRFQAVVDLLLARLEVKPKITAMASLYSEYIASLKVEIEGSVVGAGNLAFSIHQSTGDMAVQANAFVPMSVAATGTGSAVSFYVMGTASMKSAMRYTCASTWQPFTLSAAKHRITNDRLECSVVVKRGNKIWEYFGFGEAKKWMSWPKDGPFVWIEANAMEQSW